MDIGQAIVAALEFEGELLVIDPEEMKNAGVQVVNADWIFSDVVRIFVSLSDGLAWVDPTSGEPH